MVRFDYYEVLEVQRQASADDIKASYRRLARIHHPDLNGGDDAAVERFKVVAEAYGVLSDPGKRAAYDQFGHAGTRLAHPPLRRPSTNPVATVFRSVVATAGRAMKASRGADIVLQIEVDFEAAALGFIRVFELPRKSPRDPDGVRTEPRRLEFQFPAGISHGQQVRWPGEGTPGTYGGADGALEVHVQVRPHALFSRRDLDVVCPLPLLPSQLYGGGTIQVPALRGLATVTLPDFCPPGTELRLPGEGIRRTDNTSGDAVFVVVLAVPSKVSAEQLAHLQAFESATDAAALPLHRRFLHFVGALSGVLLSALAVLGAAFGSAAAAAQSEPTPHIAFLAPLSGEMEAIGQRAHRVVVMAAAVWPGPFEVHPYDTARDPAQAARDAVAAGAVAVLGPIGELESRAVAATIGPEGIPVYLLSSVHGIENTHGRTFRLVTSVADQATHLASIEVTSHPGGTWAVVAPDDAFGEEAAAAFVRAVVGQGGTVTDLVRYPPDALDGTVVSEALIGRRRAEVVAGDGWRSPPAVRWVPTTVSMPRPNAIFIADYADNVADLLPFLEFVGLVGNSERPDVRLLGPSTWLGQALQLAGDVAAGAQVTAVWHPRDRRGPAEAFTLEYEDRWGITPTAFEAEVFDAAGFVLSALQNAPDVAVTPAQFIELVDSAPIYGGVCGEMMLSEQGGVIRELGLWEVDGGGSIFPLGVIRPPELDGQ
jgi:DnaJ-class molecular chaperone/ABC-type branched-subunit amino acid transport system substrate-binding protein